MTDADVELNRIVFLSEGNPGAATALGTLVTARDDAAQVIESMESMDIRGSRIWLGYKEYCEKDIDTFARCVLNRDAGMVDLINERSAPDDPTVG
jgi:hypothetical protein